MKSLKTLKLIQVLIKNLVYKPSGIKKGDSINNDVLEVQNIKNYVVNTDSLNRESYKYLGKDLLKSKKDLFE